MPRDKIRHEIIQKIKNHPKIQGMQLQSIRNAISDIHKENPGITMNAAAHEFARKKGFSVWRDLKLEDKESLQFIKKSIVTTFPTGKRRIQRKIKKPSNDLESPFISEAYSNADAYPHVYILENSLRTVIFDEFGRGKEWWEDQKIVPKGIQDYAKTIQEKEKKYPWIKNRGDHPIYYVGLLELFKIIESNWQRFKKTFNNDLEHLRSWMKESVPIRHLIAHNIKIRKNEKNRIQQNTEYICRLIKNSKKS